MGLQSPDQIAYGRKLGQKMMMDGMSADPVQHWTQALARVLGSGVGRMNVNAADEAAQARQGATMSALDSSGALGGLSPADRALIGADPEMMRSALSKVYGDKLDPSAGMRRDLMREQIEGARQDRLHRAEMHPIERDAKRKALENPKFGAFKEGDLPYVADPGAPDGIRFIQPPNATGPGQKKFNEKAAEATAERYNEISKFGDKQPETQFNLQRLQDMSNAIGNPTAKVQFAAKYGNYLKALGLEPSKMSDIELFSSLVSKIAPTLRPAGSGATSDFDLQQYINSLPQIASTAEGRANVVKHLSAMSQYAAAQSRIAKAALIGKITREQAEIEMENLPSPHAIWRGAFAPKDQPPPALASSAPPVQTLSGQQSERAVRVRTPEDARKLPSGTTIILPDGSLGRVP